MTLLEIFIFIQSATMTHLSIKKILTVFLLVSVAFLSCGKSNDAAPANSFTWTYKGADYIATQDTAFINSYGPYFIYGGIGTSFISHSERVSFHLTSFNVGTYTFGMGSSNTLRYVDNLGFEFDGIGGKLDITFNGNNLLSGNFSATLNGPSGTTHPITGSFSNMPIKP